MKSLKELFRIGKGPSSSHTMGPQRAAKIFLERNPGSKAFEVTLYGSLAATGKGHQTDTAIIEVLSPVANVELLWRPSEFLPFHPNGMRFVAKDAEGLTLDDWTLYTSLPHLDSKSTQLMPSQKKMLSMVPNTALLSCMTQTLSPGTLSKIFSMATACQVIPSCCQTAWSLPNLWTHG